MTTFSKAVLSTLVLVTFTWGCATSRPLPSGRTDDPLAGPAMYGYFVLPATLYQSDTAPTIVLVESVGASIVVPNTPIVVAGEDRNGYFVFRSERMSHFVEIRVDKRSQAVYIAFLAPGGCALLYPAMVTETLLTVAGVAGRVYQVTLGPFPTTADGDDKCHKEQWYLVERWWKIMNHDGKEANKTNSI
ncbi:MAG: hypothetical protein HY983_03095 [Candidatus Magasanikbacteria bacterium]|nr:hypothetical protein [Candidatus Magasanikbacteria bacterium]